MPPLSPAGPNGGILFFSRGRGRGHAIPDLAIAEEFERLRPGVPIRFVSYATGAETITAHGRDVIDLHLPADNSIAQTTIYAGKLIGWLQPALVVSHEEFAALPAAKIFDKPTVFLTDWFSKPREYAMDVLHFADEILFFDEAGVYPEPEWVRGRVRYLGAALRPFKYHRADAASARAELGLPAAAAIVTVLPGSWREAETPVLELEGSAFDLLAGSKHLVWLAGADHELIASRFAGRSDVTVLQQDWQIDRLMAASSLVLNKANRLTLHELNALGVPSIALSYGLNPLDDLRSQTLPLNRHLLAAETSARTLADRVAETLAQPPSPPSLKSGIPAAAAALAVRLG